MQELLALSKSAEGRQQLLQSGRLEASAAQVAQLLLDWTPQSPAGDAPAGDLLLLLRALRNACAAGAAVAGVLLQHSVVPLAAQFAADTAAGCCGTEGRQPPAAAAPGDHPLLLAAVQLLANVSAASPDGAAAVWGALFPDKLQVILAAQQVAVHEAAALAALSCVRSSGRALADLTSSGAARQVWLQLLGPMMPQHPHAASTDAHEAPGGSGPPHGAPAAPASTLQRDAPGNDNACLLIKYVALQQGRLQQVLECLGPQRAGSPGGAAAAAAPSSSSASASSSSEGPGCSMAGLVPTPAVAVLLHVVALELAAIPAAAPLPGLAGSTQQQQQEQQHQQLAGAACAWLACVVAVLRAVWRQAVAAAPCGPGVCRDPSAAAHVLEAALQALKAVLARDEHGGGGASSSAGAGSRDAQAAAAAGIAAAAQQLEALGLVQLLLDMLKALGPPPHTKQEQQRQLEQQQQQGVGARAPPQPQGHHQPYAGYRADVVAVLANLLFGQRSVQDAVLAGGGVELLLNSCNLDEGAPLAREWALWAIRNMCEGNAAVQAYVSQYRAVGAVQSAELDRMGMQLELDHMTHKLQLVKKPGQEPQLVEQRD